MTVSQTGNGVYDARKELELLWAAEQQKKRMWAELGIEPEIALVVPPDDLLAPPMPPAETIAALPPPQTPPPQARRSSMLRVRRRLPAQSTPTRTPPTSSANAGGEEATEEKKPQAGRRGSLMTRSLFGRRGSTEGSDASQSAYAPKARRRTLMKPKAQGAGSASTVAGSVATIVV